MQKTLYETFRILQLQWRQELRTPAVLASIFLQLIATAYLCYIANHFANKPQWNALYWLSMVFAGMLSVTRNFSAYSKSRWIYYNQLVSPLSLVLAKCLYAAVLLLICAIVNFFLFVLLLDNPVSHSLIYCLIVLAGSVGLAFVYTMVSAIASKVPTGSFLIPILSLPIVIPILMLAVTASLKCLDPVLKSSVYKECLVLYSLDIVILVLIFGLFPVLWRD